MRRLRRILHPSDFSPASRAAFRTALEAAKAQRSELIIAHVVQAPMAAGLPAKMRDQVRSLAWEEAEKKLERLVRSARSAGVRATSLILGGRAAHESIVVAARRRRADLIVLSTHGRTGLPAMLLGSVASRVIATAPCPVLTVRR
jgi:nucleotide-binding universal stress UspA family protein